MMTKKNQAPDKKAHDKKAPDQKIRDQKIRDQILLSTLDQVAFDGWTIKALKNGVSDAGLSSDNVQQYFPGGVTDLVSHFSGWADRQMIEQAKDKDFASLGVRGCLAACIKARLTLCIPHREAVLRLTSYLALPQNSVLAVRLTWETCSLIWYEAGDTSADWNHYSKRSLLAAAYSATVLYWLSDEADEEGNFPETWQFIDRRLNGIVRTSGIIKRIEGSFSGLFKSVQAACVNTGDKRH